MRCFAISMQVMKIVRRGKTQQAYILINYGNLMAYALASRIQLDDGWRCGENCWSANQCAHSYLGRAVLCATAWYVCSFVMQRSTRIALSYTTCWLQRKLGQLAPFPTSHQYKLHIENGGAQFAIDVHKEPANPTLKAWHT